MVKDNHFDWQFSTILKTIKKNLNLLFSSFHFRILFHSVLFYIVLFFSSPDQSECDGQDCGSPKSFKYDPADSRSQRSPTNFSPSEASAFSKIDKTETEIHPQYDCPSKTLYHPGLFPTPFFPYTFAAFRQDNTSSNLTQSSAGSPNLYPSIAVPGNSESGKKSPASLAEKNMYYYVDPRIPFTNYFLNLTRLLSNNNASKACSAATPLSKVSEESRADERETTISPDSQKLSPGSISAGESRSVTSLDSSPVEKSFKEAVDKYHIPAYPDPHIPNPYTSLLHTAAQSSLLPLHSGGIFHPAMMQMSGAGFRRFNPEKPPPVKKYKCDVCGKAFSRSNTLVTHKVILNFVFFFFLFFFSFVPEIS